MSSECFLTCWSLTLSLVLVVCCCAPVQSSVEPGNSSSTISSPGDPPKSDEEFLLSLIGPQHRALHIIIPLTLVYCFIFVVGIFGNVTTCIVIGRIRFMHTPTNIYLLNLSISDLVVLVLGLPHDLVYYWQRYPYLFPVAVCYMKNILAEVSLCSSVLTVVAFTVERYVAICHPIRYADSESIRRAVKTVLIIWLISVLATMPYVPLVGLRYTMRNDSTTNFTEKRLEGSTTCSIGEEAFARHAVLISFIMLFFLPLCAISFLYIRIGLAIRRSLLTRRLSDNFNGTPNRAHNTVSKIRAKKAVLKMLVAVVVCFFVCFAPFHAERLMVSFIPSAMWDENQRLYQLHDILYFVSGIFYFTSTIVNPILYNLLSLKFRKASRHVLLTCCQCCTRPQPNPNRHRQQLGPQGQAFVLQYRHLGQPPITFKPPSAQRHVSRIVYLWRHLSYQCLSCFSCCRPGPMTATANLMPPTIQPVNYPLPYRPHEHPVADCPCHCHPQYLSPSIALQPPSIPPPGNENFPIAALGGENSFGYPMLFHQLEEPHQQKRQPKVQPVITAKTKSHKKKNRWKPASCPPALRSPGVTTGLLARSSPQPNMGQHQFSAYSNSTTFQNYHNFFPSSSHSSRGVGGGSNHNGTTSSYRFRGFHSWNYWTCRNIDLSSSTESAASARLRDPFYSQRLYYLEPPEVAPSPASSLVPPTSLAAEAPVSMSPSHSRNAAGSLLAVPMALTLLPSSTTVIIEGNRVNSLT